MFLHYNGLSLSKRSSARMYTFDAITSAFNPKTVQRERKLFFFQKHFIDIGSGYRLNFPFEYLTFYRAISIVPRLLKDNSNCPIDLKDDFIWADFYLGLNRHCCILRQGHFQPKILLISTLLQKKTE